MKKEKTMETMTIDWSTLTHEQRNEAVAIYVMHQCVTRIPATYGIPEISVLLDERVFITSACPRYTENIGVAWDIAGRFHNATVTLISKPGVGHHAKIRPLGDNQRTYNGLCLSAAEALCIAALRACGLTILNSEMDIISSL
jgi:hypothetical protein